MFNNKFWKVVAYVLYIIALPALVGVLLEHTYHLFTVFATAGDGIIIDEESREKEDK